MPYIGKSPHFGVRSRFLFVADASDTSVSGADANGATLTFTDGAFVDVYLNGVLLKAGTDYNTNTANTIAGLSALSANDEVTVLVYDVFSAADTVSATSGGTFSGATTHNAGITSTSITATGDVSLDGGSFVFNESGADKDFRIESANDVYALFMNGEKGHFGIGSNNSDYMGSNNTGGVLSLTVPTGGYAVFELAAEGADSDGALAGTMNFVNTLQTGGVQLANIRGRTDGSTSTDRGGSLAFGTKPDGGSSPTERMRITANGRIGIGDTGQTNTKMTITENTDSDITGLKVTTGVSSYDGITIWSVHGSSVAASSILYGGYANSGHRFFVRADGDIETAGSTTVSSISDINYKENIVDANSQWDDIKAMRFVNYSYKEDKLDKPDKLGLIAQELEKVSPNLVFTRNKVNNIQYIKDKNKKTIDEFGNEIDNPNYGKDIDNPDFGKKIKGETYKTVKMNIVTLKATKALQEAMERIETLEAKVKALESK